MAIMAAFLLLVFCAVGLPTAPQKSRLPLKRFTLPNGLRVVVAPDRTLPLVSVTITYKVGATDDPPDRDGLAHLVEHMMFKGSVNVADGEHYALVAEAGGSTGGITGGTVSPYHTTVPSNQLEMALFLEADRMRGLRMTDEGLANQKLAVRSESAASARSEYPSQKIAALTNAHRLLLDEVTLADAIEFYNRHYGPNNAVLVVGGDVDTPAAEVLVKKYFTRVPSINLKPTELIPSPQREAFRDGRRKTSEVFLAYALPGMGGREDIPIQMFQRLLTRRSRVRGQQPSSAKERLPGPVTALIRHYGRDRFLILSSPVPKGLSTDEIEVMLHDELSRVARDEVGPSEISGLRNAALVSFASSLLILEWRNELLAEAELLGGDAALVNGRESQIRSCNAGDLLRVAAGLAAAPPTFVIIAEPAAADRKEERQ